MPISLVVRAPLNLASPFFLVGTAFPPFPLDFKLWLQPDCNWYIETCLVWCGSLKHLPPQFMKQKMLGSFTLSKCFLYIETVIASPSLNSGYACFYFLTRAVVSASHDWSALIVRGVVWLNSSDYSWSFRLCSIHGNTDHKSQNLSSESWLSINNCMHRQFTRPITAPVIVAIHSEVFELESLTYTRTSAKISWNWLRLSSLWAALLVLLLSGLVLNWSETVIIAGPNRI